MASRQEVTGTISKLLEQHLKDHLFISVEQQRGLVILKLDEQTFHIAVEEVGHDQELLPEVMRKADVSINSGKPAI